MSVMLVSNESGLRYGAGLRDDRRGDGGDSDIKIRLLFLSERTSQAAFSAAKVLLAQFAFDPFFVDRLFVNN